MDITCIRFVDELGTGISTQLKNQAEHLANKLDEAANKIVSAPIRPTQ